MLINIAKESFLLSLEAMGGSERTIETYDQRIRMFTEFIGRCDIEGVTPEIVELWLVKQRRRGLSGVTIKGRFTAVKTFFSWLVKRGYLESSPTESIKLKRPPRLLRCRAASPENVKRMVEVARRKAEQGQSRDLALMLFMIDTGCRAGEVAGLLWEHLRIEKREALVNGKTGPGMVDFTHETAAALTNWLEQHPALDSPFVFVGLHHPNKGRGITAGTVYQALRRLAKEANVNGRFNPHSIRHLVCMRWVDETNLELARQKMRHADISTTALYANQDREKVKRFTDEIRIV